MFSCSFVAKANEVKRKGMFRKMDKIKDNYLKLWRQLLIKQAIELVAFELEFDDKISYNILKNDFHNGMNFSDAELNYIMKTSKKLLKSRSIVKELTNVE